MRIHTRQGKPGKGGMGMGYGLRTLAYATALAGLLTGCEGENYATGTPPYPAVEHLREPPTTFNGAPVESTQQPQIAYTYTYNFELPARQVLPLSEQHRALCEEAGPNQCWIDRTAREDLGAQMNVWIELRATPEWLAGFRARLIKDASDADGRIANFRMESEDLSPHVVDTQAHLRAQTTLRDRLQNLLAARTGKVSELLEIERELTRVQGELDSTRSRLNHLRTQVAMSEVKLYYGTDPGGQYWRSTSAPNYFMDIWQTTRNSTLTMIMVMFAVLPWLLPPGLLVWGLYRLWAARRKAKLAAKAAADAASD